ELWGFDHGTDWRGDSIPPEELNKIIDSADYGWPLVYGKQQVDETREDPVGSTKAAYAKTTIPAEMTFPAHSAPLDFLFLNKLKNIDPKWKDDGLVTWHGSWNRKKPEGFKVQRIHFENGKPVSAEDFLWGFLSANGNTRFGRPTGLIMSADKIFISDDANGVIYCVTPVNK
ncbi:MAG: glucose dehydrogenase, partial [Chitinophagaceae bacterium]